MPRINHSQNPTYRADNASYYYADIIKKWSDVATPNSQYARKVQDSVMTAMLHLQQPGRGLQRLDLYACGLTTLPPITIWQQLEGITILDLSDNMLAGSELEKLAALTSLQQLYLSGNPLKNIPESTLEHQDSMAIFEAEKCLLCELPQNMLTLHQLDTLRLRGNPLHSLPESLGYNMPCLATLDIRDTTITVLPESLKMLENLIIERSSSATWVEEKQ